jgi:hypothetical protein
LSEDPASAPVAPYPTEPWYDALSSPRLMSISLVAGSFCSSPSRQYDSGRESTTALR